jgi:hypothetical protein
MKSKSFLLLSIIVISIIVISLIVISLICVYMEKYSDKGSINNHSQSEPTKKNIFTKPTLDEIRMRHPSVEDWDGEIVEQKLIHETIFPGDRILEFGANIGRSSIVAAECTGPNGYVRSFESNKIDREKAKNNAKPLTNIEFMPAVSDVPLFQNAWNTSTFKHNDSWEEVDVVTTTILNGHWDVIIVDCEGCFSNIILNKSSIIDNTRILIFEHDDADKEREKKVKNLLLSKDYKIKKCVEHNNRPPCFWAIYEKEVSITDFEIMNTRMYNPDKLTGIAKYTDIVIKNPEKIFFKHNKSFDNCKSIFLTCESSGIRAKSIDNFIDNILPQIKNPVILIIAGVDYTFPNQIDKRGPKNSHNLITKFKNLSNNNNITKIWVENLDEDMKKTYPIPLGLSVAELESDNDKPPMFSYFKPFENINKDKLLLVTNFNRTRDGKGQWYERGIVDKLCKNEWKDFIIAHKHSTHKKYLKELAKYSFTLCIHGGGVDVNPKLFEAILVGTIPIIRKNDPYTNIYKDWPVVIIDDWDKNTINKNNLELWKSLYMPYFTCNLKRQLSLKKLSLKYWVEKTLL